MQYGTRRWHEPCLEGFEADRQRASQRYFGFSKASYRVLDIHIHLLEFGTEKGPDPVWLFLFK